jgi:hypothetical protein
VVLDFSVKEGSLKTLGSAETDFALTRVSPSLDKDQVKVAGRRRESISSLQSVNDAFDRTKSWLEDFIEMKFDERTNIGNFTSEEISTT